MPATPVSQPLLSFDATLATKQLVDIRNNLSAICQAGGHLWLGGDEGTFIERLTPVGQGGFGAHRRFDLAPILGLPAAAGGGSEIDIEGLDSSGGCLWVIGSHSLKRKKADPAKTPDKNRERLATVEPEPNRHTLARIPLDANGEPVAAAGGQQAARLEAGESGSALFAALVADKLLGRFCTIPSKDNGIDIEGLAVAPGNRIFAGLRGPVLRGWAVVLEFECKDAGPGALALATPVKKHLLQLEGLGVRELAIDGNDLCVLAGPSMDLDGPVFVYRWPKALETTGEALLFRENLRKMLAVPFAAGADHAEGIALTATGSLMICYDSPAPHRLVDGHPEQVRLDEFELSPQDLDSFEGAAGIL